ncbi:MAG: hypothetical protein HY721_23860, partial [Planctomycetes bacterium]|nr:hypothetical protein [Planctomycetota bacterium]
MTKSPTTLTRPAGARGWALRGALAALAVCALTLALEPVAALAQDAAAPAAAAAAKPPTPAEAALAEMSTPKVVADTIWVLVTAMLVFWMNAGFGCLE